MCASCPTPPAAAWGYALARAAARAGHEAVLVSGPVALKPPAGVEVVSVVSTGQMYAAVRKLWSRADCLIGAAAPADYTPERRARGKGKKQPDGLTLRMKPTVDILATLGRRKGRRVVVAFALGGAERLGQRPRQAEAQERRRHCSEQPPRHGGRHVGM